MDAEFFARQVEAEALQAQISWDFNQIRFQIVAAASMGKTEVSVTTRNAISEEITDRLDMKGISVMSDKEVSDGFVTRFDIGQLGAYSE